MSTYDLFNLPPQMPIPTPDGFVIEDGDTMVDDYPESRYVQIAIQLWSEGSVSSPSKRERITWYADRRNGLDSSYRVMEKLPPRTSGPPPVTEAYFNTVSVKGEDLKERHKKVGKQNADILAVMQELKSATPSQVHSRMNTKAPLTSFRRAINTLTADGYLVKTEEKVMGPFGHPEHVWKLKE